MIRFPWPNPKFFVNKKIAHRWLKPERDTAKQIGFYLVKDAGLRVAPDGFLQIRMIVFPPDRKVYDDDGIYTAFKHYRDGMFMALETDDRRIRHTEIDWGDIEQDGALYVEIKEFEWTPAKPN